MEDSIKKLEDGFAMIAKSEFGLLRPDRTHCESRKLANCCSGCKDEKYCAAEVATFLNLLRSQISNKAYDFVSDCRNNLLVATAGIKPAAPDFIYL